MPGRDDMPMFALDRQSRADTGDRDPHRVGGDFEARTAVQDFERRRSRRIADERIAEAQAEAVERT